MCVHALKTKHSRFAKGFCDFHVSPFEIIQRVHIILSEERESENIFVISPSQTPPTAEEMSDVPMETADSADPQQTLLLRRRLINNDIIVTSFHLS